MYLYGSITELKNVISAAKLLKAKAIHFISPNIIFILGFEKDEYVFLRSSIEIRQSVVLSHRQYQNLSIYLNQGIQQAKHPSSIFFDEDLRDVTVTGDGLIFNDDERLYYSVKILYKMLTHEVEDRLHESIQSSFSEDVPYMQLSNDSFQKIRRMLSRSKKLYGRRGARYDKSYMRVVNHQITFQKSVQDEQVEIDTGVEEFQTNMNLKNDLIVSDRAVFLMGRFSLKVVIDEIILLQHQNFFILEAHGPDLRIKVRTRYENDHENQKV